VSGTAGGAPVVFISYRRDDSSGHVGRLYDALSARFGSNRLFFDIDHIGAGQDFVRVIDDAVTRSTVMLVVIGKRWAGTCRVGSRRVDDPGDFVRLEVAAGLRRELLRLIPVLIQGAKMPSAATLPDELKDLARRNAVELSDTRWKEDVARLIASLGDAGTGKRTPAAAAALLTGSDRPPWVRAAAIGALALVILAGGYGLMHRTPTTQAQSPGAVTHAAIPSGAVPTTPSRLDQGARGAIEDARRWRNDALLTSIDVRPPQNDASADHYRVEYAFRSPTDGAGLTVLTGDPGGTQYNKLPPAGKSALRALPDTFVDLNDALQAAKGGGLFGPLQSARLAVGTGSRAGRPTWTIRPGGADQSRTYVVDGVSGKLVETAASSKRPGGLIGKVKKIFH